MQDRGKMATIIFTPTMAASLGGFAGFARPSWAQGARSQATYRDIEQTRGAVPTFFKLFRKAASPAPECTPAIVEACYALYHFSWIFWIVGRFGQFLHDNHKDTSHDCAREQRLIWTLWLARARLPHSGSSHDLIAH